VKKDYIRYINKSDPTSWGTYTLQTSGNPPLTGKVVDSADFIWHSYQLNPVDGLGTYQGELFVEISNDGSNWHPVQSGSFANRIEGSGVFISEQFLSKYVRPVLTGNGGADYVISEIHRQ
jgi:hypothetical protein